MFNKFFGAMPFGKKLTESELENNPSIGAAFAKLPDPGPCKDKRELARWFELFARDCYRARATRTGSLPNA